MSSPATSQASVPLEGRLGDPAILPRLFSWLARGQWSGAVVARAGEIERRIHFLDGRIAAATSNDPSESLQSLLMRAGQLRVEDIERLGSLGGERGGSFGRQLVRLGLLAERDLLTAERRRTVAIGEAALGMRSGTYTAESGASGVESGSHAIDVARLIATGVMKSWEDLTALEVLGGADSVLDIAADRLGDYEATGAQEAYDLTFLRVNGQRSVAEILAIAPLPETGALRFLAALRLIGCIEVVPGARRAPAPLQVSSSLRREEQAPRLSRDDDDAFNEEVGAQDGEEQEAAPRSARAPRQPEASGPRRWLFGLLALVLLGALAWAAWVGLDEFAAGSNTGAPSGTP